MDGKILFNLKEIELPEIDGEDLNDIIKLLNDIKEKHSKYHKKLYICVIDKCNSELDHNLWPTIMICGEK
jgi:hypothetical protein